MMKINKIYKCNCLKGLKRLSDNFIDLIVTSPPYDKIRNYDNKSKFTFKIFKKIAKELYRVTKKGGIVVWIIKDGVTKGSESGTSFRHALYFKKIGFNLHDTMIYQKNAMPFPEQTTYIQCFEYMFILSKSKPKTTNLLKEPTKGYKSQGSTQRNVDGTTTKIKGKRNKPLRSKWNIWKYNVGYNHSSQDKIAFKHPATFPEKLVQDHILSWSNENDLVLDPFMGSGTTAKMCVLNNRNFIGFEINKEYIKIAKERIKIGKREKSNK